MVICGIELKGSEAIIALIDVATETITFRNIEPKRIKLADDESKDSVRAFYDAFSTFLKNNDIDAIAIKKRAKKGNFSGGAVSFKMEGLIQLGSKVRVELIASQALSAYVKNKPIKNPDTLKQYQQQAFLTACCAFSRVQDV
jgi:hypothetical protein